MEDFLSHQSATRDGKQGLQPEAHIPAQQTPKRHCGDVVADMHTSIRLAVAMFVTPIATLFLWFTVSWATSPLRGSTVDRELS